MVCSHELMCLRMTESGTTSSFQPLDVGAGLNSCPPQDQCLLFSEVYLKIFDYNYNFKLCVFSFICVALSMSRESKERRKCNRSPEVRGSWESIDTDAKIQTLNLQESRYHSKLKSHLSFPLKMLNDLFYTLLKESTEFSNNSHGTQFFL